MIPPARQSSLCLCLGFCVALCGTVSGQATDTFINQQRNLEEQIRAELDRELTVDQRASLDFGGSYNFFVFLYDDGVNSSRTLRRHDGRLWVRATADEGTHEGYARGRLSYVDFNSGDSLYGRDDDWDGPNLERGYYQFCLKNAMKAYARQRVPYDLRLKIGRQYVELGTGYAVSLPLDAIMLTGELAGFQIMGLMGNSVHSWDDIDQSRPGSDSSDRNFFAVQVKYTGIRQHEPYFYAAWNDDRSNENPVDPLQSYSYDSRYFGFGSTGSIVSTNVRYSTEWVFEGGRSYGDRMFLYKDTIHAWGWDMIVEYLMPVPMKPKLQAEYMFASGDGGRLYSPTNAVGGNTGDREDTSFIGFGYRDTGLSFAPSLSNVHIWRVGASFFPFERMEFLKEMELGTDWFLYAKHHSAGAVSDGLADLDHGFLGWEMDWFANWRITSDLSWTARYGVFFPGGAFGDQTTRYFFVTGLTWSF